MHTTNQSAICRYFLKLLNWLLCKKEFKNGLASKIFKNQRLKYFFCFSVFGLLNMTLERERLQIVRKFVFSKTSKLKKKIDIILG